MVQSSGARTFPLRRGRWPDFYEGKWIIGDFVRNWILVATLNDDRTKVTSLERLVPEEEFSSLMDLEFGPNGDLYVLEYGTQWSSNNADARLSKVVFNAGNRAPKVMASSDRTAGATPLVLTLSSSGHGRLRRRSAALPVDGVGTGRRTRTTVHRGRAACDAGPSWRLSGVPDGNGLPPACRTPHRFRLSRVTNRLQVKLELTQGNRTFFIPGQSVSYRAVVTDKEDGRIADDRVFVTAEYVPTGVTRAQLAAVKDAFRPAESFRHLSAIGLMAKNDCRVCHQVDAKSVGPSFMDISRKYKDEAGAVDRLTQKVITGGSGVWGTVAMAAHPNLTQSEASALVAFILSTADTTRAPQRLPAQGTYAGGAEGLVQSQQAAMATLNASVAPLQLAATTARTALTAASLTLPVDPRRWTRERRRSRQPNRRWRRLGLRPSPSSRPPIPG